MSEYEQFVRGRLGAGDDPNAITDSIREALFAAATDWTLHGDEVWRLDTVCPVCGASYAGVCGHAPMGIEPVLRREYVPGQHGDPAIVMCSRCRRTGTREDLGLDGIFIACSTCQADLPQLRHFVPLHRETAR